LRKKIDPRFLEVEFSKNKNKTNPQRGVGFFCAIQPGREKKNSERR